MKTDLAKLPGYIPPADRPKCVNCGKALKPYVDGQLIRDDTPQGCDTRWLRTRIRHYGVDRHQIFCTLRCGYAYGVRAAKRANP